MNTFFKKFIQANFGLFGFRTSKIKKIFLSEIDYGEELV